MTDVGSQVIVQGDAQGHMDAVTYYEKSGVCSIILDAYISLASNTTSLLLKAEARGTQPQTKRYCEHGLRRLVGAPVLLVGDIDRGGVFAQLYGTIALLEKEERERVQGIVVNKFRGDRTILQPGLDMLEKLCGVPVAGLIPYICVDLDSTQALTNDVYREQQYDILADAIRHGMDMDFVYRILNRCA